MELGGGRVFVGRFGGAVELTNPAVPGGVEWRHESPHRTSITGEAPQVFGHGEALLALMPLNQGRELTCFDPATGAPRWTLPPHLCHDGFDVSLALLDDGAVYYPYRNRLIARSLKDGRELWKLALPTGVGPWQVDRFGPSLLVWRRSFAGIPSVLAFADPLTAPCTVWFGRRGLAPLPILLIDPTTGGIRQRFDLPHDHGPVFAQVHGDRLIATAGGAVHGFTPD